MKNLSRKLAFSAAVTLLLLATAFFSLKGMESRLINADQRKHTEAMSSHLKDACAEMLTLRDQILAWGDARVTDGAELTARGLKDLVIDGEYTGPRAFEDGAVVRLIGGEIDCPEELPAGFIDVSLDMLDPQSPDYGAPRRTDFGLMTARCIDGDWYYVQRTDGWKLNQYVNDYVDSKSLMEALSESYGGEVLVVDRRSEGRLAGESGPFEEAYTPAQLGLTDDMLVDGPVRFTLQGEERTGHVENLDERGISLIFPYSDKSAASRATDRALQIVAVMLAMLIPVFVWLSSVQRRVRDGMVSEAQKAKYAPRRVLRHALRLGLLCAIAAAALTGVIHGISTLFGEYQDGSRILNCLETQLTTDHVLDEAALCEEQEWNRFYAERAAELLAVNPALWDREHLSALSDAVGADHIMLFDQNGDETLCSADYVGFNLGDDDTSPLYDFRRLLKGVPSIVHIPMTGSVTGLDQQLTGARLKLPGAGGRFGALLLAMPAAQLERRQDLRSDLDIMEMLTPDDCLCLGIDPESGIVVSATDPALAARDAASLGLRGESLLSAGMDVLNLDGNLYYAAAANINGIVYYYALNGHALNQAIFRAAAIAMALMLAVYGLMIFCLLRGYDESSYKQYAVTGVGSITDDGTVEVMMPDGTMKRTLDPARRWKLLPTYWKQLSPEDKGLAALNVMLCAFALYILCRVTLVRLHHSSGPYTFLMYGSWSRGINLFALVAIGLALCEMHMGLTVARLLERLLCGLMDAKSDTICRLVFGFIRYIVIIVVMYHAFTYLGFDTRALLASLGFASLALSLGARDLVTDMLAGINIVLEGEFEVGDIVEIGGYRGTVEEIGVRTVKLVGQGDNVRIVSNRDVKNVLNMTRLNSWYAVELSFPATQSLEDVEKLLSSELAKIGEHIPEIISGPFYKGIIAVSSGKYTVSVIAECREKDYRRVQRSMNKAIYTMFRSNDIPLL